MPDLQVSDVQSLYAWAAMLVNNTESYFFPLENLQIDFFGQGDSALLVIDVYTSKSTLVHYEFVSVDRNQKDKTIIILFDWLKMMDFSLQKVIRWLANSDFEKTDDGNKLTVNELNVYRSNLEQCT